jgi:hypothetical protein
LVAGTADKLWLLEDVADPVEARAAKPEKRGAYKSRQPKV